MLWGIVLTIICEDSCPDCNQNFLKQPENLGDYEKSGTLMRFCPCCGQMLPFLEIWDEDEELISNSLKRRIGTRVARTNELDYVVINDIIKDLKEVKKKKEFFKRFSRGMLETFDLIIKEDDLFL